MAVLETIPQTDFSLVEVSGWDENEIFFVENSPLAGEELAGNYISLAHMLAEGAIIFVRTVQPQTFRRACPAAFAAEFVGCDAEGRHQLRLNPVQPRYARERSDIN